MGSKYRKSYVKQHQWGQAGTQPSGSSRLTRPSHLVQPSCQAPSHAQLCFTPFWGVEQSCAWEGAAGKKG